MVYDTSERRAVEVRFRKWAKLHSLPAHKALRKTVTQLIHDHVSEDAARLYRGEGTGSTHGRSYVRFSEAQEAKLESVLKKPARKSSPARVGWAESGLFAMLVL